MPEPTFKDELQRKHEEALVALASDYDAGAISFPTLKRAAEAVIASVVGLVDAEALSEMSAFIKSGPEKADDKRLRVFTSRKEPKVYVLGQEGFDLNLTVIEFKDGRVKTSKATLESCVAPEVLERRMVELTAKLNKAGEEI